jgi:hypothetical protein
MCQSGRYGGSIPRRRPSEQGTARDEEKLWWGSGLPIVYDADDTLYMIENYNEDSQVYEMLTQADDATLLDTFAFVGFSPAPGADDLVHALALNPDDGLIYAAMTNGDLAIMDVSSPGNITVTYVGSMDSVLDGLAFIPVEVETTGE